jgi:hypothetical protein
MTPLDDRAERRLTLRLVTWLMSAVIALTFLFGFGNVWTLAVRLGVPPWVAPLVAPAVDLSVMALLLATRYMALHGASREQLRPARGLLIFSSLMTLALNVADPLIAGHWGRAAFDAVGPLLLIGWSEVGPGLLQALATAGSAPTFQPCDAESSRAPEDILLSRARQEDARHWQETHRPISAETLRRRLHIGAARSRSLVADLRALGPPPSESRRTLE